MDVEREYLVGDSETSDEFLRRCGKLMLRNRYPGKYQTEGVRAGLFIV